MSEQKPLKSAFGIPLRSGTDKRYLTGDDSSRAAFVSFFKDDHGWTGRLQVGDVVIPESIGAASAQACYQSLRGRVLNHMAALVKLGVKP